MIMHSRRLSVKSGAGVQTLPRRPGRRRL